MGNGASVESWDEALETVTTELQSPVLLTQGAKGGATFKSSGGTIFASSSGVTTAIDTLFRSSFAPTGAAPASPPSSTASMNPAGDGGAVLDESLRAVDLVVDTMRANRGDPRAAVLGCRALQTLARQVGGAPGARAACQQRMVAAGALELVAACAAPPAAVAAIADAFTTATAAAASGSALSPSARRYALGALAAMVSKCREAQKRALELGALPAAVAAVLDAVALADPPPPMQPTAAASRPASAVAEGRPSPTLSSPESDASPGRQHRRWASLVSASPGAHRIAASTAAVAASASLAIQRRLDRAEWAAVAERGVQLIGALARGFPDARGRAIREPSPPPPPKAAPRYKHHSPVKAKPGGGGDGQLRDAVAPSPAFVPVSGLTAVVAAMDAFPDAASVQLAGCSCLVTLASGGGGGGSGHSDRSGGGPGGDHDNDASPVGGGREVVALAALPSVAACLGSTAPPPCSAVRREALRCVAALTAGRARGVAAKRCAAREGCVELALGCLMACGSSGPVCEQACAALANLVSAPGSDLGGGGGGGGGGGHSSLPPFAAAAAASEAAVRRSSALGGGGAGLVLRALKLHGPGDEGAAFSGCCALAALAGGGLGGSVLLGRGDDAALVALVSPGGGKFRAVLTPPRPRASGTGCGVKGISDLSPARGRPPASMRNPSASAVGDPPTLPPAAVRAAVRAGGGLRAVVEALSGHPASGRVQQAGCLALSLLWRLGEDLGGNNNGGGGNGNGGNNGNVAAGERAAEEAMADACRVAVAALRASVEGPVTAASAGDGCNGAATAAVAASTSTVLPQRPDLFPSALDDCSVAGGAGGAGGGYGGGGGGDDGGPAATALGEECGQASALAVAALARSGPAYRRTLAGLAAVPCLVSALRAHAVPPPNPKAAAARAKARKAAGGGEDGGAAGVAAACLSALAALSLFGVEDLMHALREQPHLVHPLPGAENDDESSDYDSDDDSGGGGGDHGDGGGHGGGQAPPVERSTVGVSGGDGLLRTQALGSGGGGGGGGGGGDGDGDGGSGGGDGDGGSGGLGVGDGGGAAALLRFLGLPGGAAAFAGCAALAVGAMRAHLSRLDVQRAGCLALSGLASEAAFEAASAASAARLKGGDVGAAWDAAAGGGGHSHHGHHHHGHHHGGGEHHPYAAAAPPPPWGSVALVGGGERLPVRAALAKAGGLDAIADAGRAHPADAVVRLVCASASRQNSGGWRAPARPHATHGHAQHGH